ncbi:MAG: murein peptide amidase A [Magnetococcales bacterium]|nr:murein peptide amidase A [Magnetococcales bacterium]
MVEKATLANASPQTVKKTDSGQKFSGRSVTLPISPVTGEGSVQALCQKIGRKLGSVSPESCHAADLRPTGYQSVNGLALALKEYPPLSNREPQARVMVLGGIHGDEYSSVSIAFKWMQTLDRYHSGLFHWRVLPLVNPDGLLQKRSQRMNANGVDLNRNFPTFNWLEESRDYWVRRTGRDPRRYPGQAPLSEPESRWLAEEIVRFKPHVIISIHAPLGLLDFDGHRPKPPKKLGHLHLDLMGTYPGSLGRFAGVQEQIPIITIELSYAGIMPSRGEQRRIWRDLVGWLRGNIFDPNQAHDRTFKAANEGIDVAQKGGDVTVGSKTP